VPASPVDETSPVAFEQRLRRSGARSAVEAADPDLRLILSYVSERRGGRAGGPGPGAPPVDGEVLAVQVVGPTVRIFQIRRQHEFAFRAGQHVRVGLRGNRRAKFSIASAPHEDHVELCIQLVADGRLTPALFGLRQGDAIDIADSAKGGFALRAGQATHLMVATGTGIAPFRSMMRDAWHRRTSDRFIVLHGASHLDELPYRQELEGCTGVDYRATISRPTEVRNRGWSGLTGRVDQLAEVVAATLDPASTHVYACGNRGMADAVDQRLGALGFVVAREVYD
jgi:ferredoxin-NADP reductase